MKWKLNITKDTKVTVLGLQESTFPFLQEEEYDFKAQQTSETIKYMHYVHGSTSSFHLSVLMLDTKKTTVPTPLTMEAPVSIVSSLVSAIFTDKIW